ncbi:MAG: acyl-ACP--UDP-N-acetylglucosamine O-acyltransferase [Muribaculaceae bacterium]|nr:acyl-ACP--UDP-N-acetylglucosamine O-acyltransferase [Muribaculaceae bacterium]
MISPLAYVDPKAQLGNDVIVHPFAYIDADTVIGDGCEILPYASVMHGTTLGKKVKVYQGAIVGADPQDFRWKGCASHCFVGDNTIIREHVIINRGITGEGGTSIGANSFVFADSHIGHDTHIADKCVIGNAVTIAGDVHVDTGSILSSSVVLHEGVHVGKLALIKGGTRISSNVPPFAILAHNPVAYYGVNAIVLRKHGGFTEEQIDDIAKAYRHIYQTQTSLFNALRRIEDDIDDSPVRKEILDFIRANELKLAGDRFEAE